MDTIIPKNIEIVGILFCCFLITRCLKIINVNGFVNIKVASKAEELKPALFHVRPRVSLALETVSVFYPPVPPPEAGNEDYIGNGKKTFQRFA